MAITAHPPQFSCPVNQRATEAVVAPRGELDLATTAILQPALDEVLARGARRLTVDLGGVTFVDSTALRCLLALASRARRDGFDLELVPPAPPVMRVFELTATHDVLPFRSAA